MTTAMVTYVNISIELIQSGYNLMTLKILNTSESDEETHDPLEVSDSATDIVAGN